MLVKVGLVLGIQAMTILALEGLGLIKGRPE